MSTRLVGFVPAVVLRRLRVGFAAAAVALATMTLPLAPAARGSASSGGNGIPHFDRDNFSHPTRIDNKWYPLVPGTQFVLVGRIGGGGGLLPHRVIFTVTDVTKVINGVRTRVLWDRDINEGQLAEAELAFQAQDDDRNVWNMGEYPEEFEEGKFVGAPSTWIAGLARAKAGIAMLAKPRVGTPAYVQGFAPAIDFLDKAKVFQEHQKVCVPFDCYHNVLVIDEWSPLDPEAGHQHKWYAPRVGNVQVTPAGGQEQETLVLVKLAHLGPAARAKVCAEALRLDRRAYRVSKLYRHTPPARPGLGCRAAD